MTSPVIEFRIEIDASYAPAIEESLAEKESTEWMVQEGRPSGRTWLTGYFPTEQAATDSWAALSPAITTKAIIGERVIREIAATDWRESYKAHFKPWQLGRLHWVPVWERDSYPLPAGDEVVWLDPGMAFGTGNHETTRLCCERLVEFVDRERDAGVDLSTVRVIDAGCGSGILAISAAKLGLKQIRAFDIDADAVRIAAENFELNHTLGAVELFTADLPAGLRRGPADLILANIQADVLMRFAAELAAALAPGGILVLSGILAVELEQVKASFAKAVPQCVIDSRTLGEWSDLVVGK